VVAVTITVSDQLAQELNQIAQEMGHANAKQMVLSFLRGHIVAKRCMTAKSDAQAPAEQEAEGGIT